MNITADNGDDSSFHYPQTVRRFHQLDSTNTWALQNAADFSAAELPLLVIAEHQTQGRGRSGRSWHADGGTLTFSILDSTERLQIERSFLPRLALIAGLSVAEAIESFVPPISARIKWPNDVYVAGGKVAGLLVESVALPLDRVVIGIGVNVSTDFSYASEEIRARAKSLACIAGRPLDPQHLLSEILERLKCNMESVEANFVKLVQQLRARCCLSGQSISLQHGERLLTGMCRGIDDSGALRIESNGQIVAVQSGEIVRFATA